MMIGYQRALKGPKAQNLIQSDKPESFKMVMRNAMCLTWKHLAKERLRDLKPNIPLAHASCTRSRQDPHR
jgi:hypothetical protein